MPNYRPDDDSHPQPPGVGNPWAVGNTEPSEYSWGPGLSPRCARNASPARGGMYAGRSPRHGQPVRTGYPGEPVAGRQPTPRR
ncbi:hypothetical protein [Mycolicibacter heraklionensis]|uniref:hypothetical protein n=1 Tax=Mycolicibacter heraklionensis TaxID=512402 RepID=UPI00103A4412|nr:hypothetical protein [Mycolicibacter heraklionensis]